jgi:hypothetical protein
VDLSNVSFEGKLLVLPANVRLELKVFARHKHSCLFGLIVNNKGKKFYNMDTWCIIVNIYSDIDTQPNDIQDNDIQHSNK